MEADEAESGGGTEAARQRNDGGGDASSSASSASAPWEEPSWKNQGSEHHHTDQQRHEQWQRQRHSWAHRDAWQPLEALLKDAEERTVPVPAPAPMLLVEPAPPPAVSAWDRPVSAILALSPTPAPPAATSGGVADNPTTAAVYSHRRLNTHTLHASIPPDGIMPQQQSTPPPPPPRGPRVIRHGEDIPWREALKMGDNIEDPDSRGARLAGVLSRCGSRGDIHRFPILLITLYLGTDSSYASQVS